MRRSTTLRSPHSLRFPPQAEGKLSPSAAKHLVDFLALPDLCPVERASIAELLDAEDWEEIEHRFGPSLFFGTGGIRSRTIGRVPTAAERGGADPGEPPRFPAVGTATLNPRTVRRTALGLGRYLLRSAATRPLSAVIARDTRLFSAEFADVCADALRQLGFRVWVFPEERPTPELSFAIRRLSADAGIMVTASHNPPWDNGLKVYLSDGGQITNEVAEGVSRAIEEIPFSNPLRQEGPPGPLEPLGPDLDQAYFEAVESAILEPAAFRLATRRVRVVYTPLHGAGLRTVPALLARQGIDCSLVKGQDTPDGRFPGVSSANPEDSRSLAEAIAQASAEGRNLVLGTDPDADRLGAAVRDTAGGWRILTGNQIAALLAYYRCERTFARRAADGGAGIPVLLKTFVTTDLLRAIAESFGVRCVETLTGFKHIAAKLRRYEEIAAKNPQDRRRLIFGGEESHGCLCTDRVREKDGSAAALQLVEAAGWAARDGKTLPGLLDWLYRRFGFFAERLHTLTLEGTDGSRKRNELLASFREAPPRGPGGDPPVGTEDFETEDHWDADGELLPREPFLRFSFRGGERLAVRCSGTEPKLKFYLFHQAGAEHDLRAQEERVEARLAAWWRAIAADAQSRLSR
ncbi:Phosphomannomutase [Methylacidimicrobium sp. AP8]|uniref:phospho-sugar mutase n=1 Tax=Methylacidimicrobium sp. AP8 TaxID=2730359 RepID=UPI0018BF9F4D|nr:phospho-sugar mutase [Methylacidimicrobium sp. AP8]CAB4242628.1 Phosphomannomutase [Methylacidimicrobium sp. AP8]